MNETQTNKTFLQKLRSFLFTPEYSLRNVLMSLLLGMAIAYVTVISVYGVSGGNHIVASLFKQDFLNSNTIAKLVSKVAVLGLAGIAVAFGMKAGILNIGVSGQMTAGGFLGYYIIKETSWMQNVDHNSMVLLVMFFIVVLTSIFMALISGVLKAFFKVNEVISTIMLNWIAVYVVKRYSTTEKGDAMQVATGSPKTFSDVRFTDGNEWIFAIVGILILITAAVAAWVYLTMTKGGFKLIAVGKNKSAAEYSGYETRKMTLIAFAISGLFAGLAGYVSFFLSYNTIPALEAPIGDGFTGIAVALVAMLNPLGAIPAAVLFGLLNGPVDGIIVAGYAPDVVFIFSGVITYFVAISNLFLIIRPIESIRKFRARRAAVRGGVE